nr:ead/Ea22-like family protein [Klebsiella pneumoniae]
MTAEKLEEIRQRYRPTLAPKCHICGVEMTIQRMSASRITYGCAGAIYDETGCHYAEDRSLADDHYAESRITVVDVSDPDVLAMVEALEKAQRANAAQEDHINQQQDRIESLEKKNAELGKYAGKLETINAAAEKLVRCKGRYHSEQNYRALAALFGLTTPDLPPLEHENVHYADVAEIEIAALRQRIADLESRTVSAAAADVLAERQRQVTAEGWSSKHDDQYKNTELAFAASCYAFHAAAASWDLEDDGIPYDSHPVPKQWPWDPSWWKPTDARRDLVKAGALILAEIERIDRAAGIKWEAE